MQKHFPCGGGGHFHHFPTTVTESRKKSKLRPAVTSLHITFFTMQYRCEFPYCPSIFLRINEPTYMYQNFSQEGFFYKIVEPSSKLAEI